MFLTQARSRWSSSSGSGPKMNACLVSPSSPPLVLVSSLRMSVGVRTFDRVDHEHDGRARLTSDDLQRHQCRPNRLRLQERGCDVIGHRVDDDEIDLVRSDRLVQSMGIAGEGSLRPVPDLAVVEHRASGVHARTDGLRRVLFRRT